jgi:hypothetical protein
MTIRVERSTISAWGLIKQLFLRNERPNFPATSTWSAGRMRLADQAAGARREQLRVGHIAVFQEPFATATACCRRRVRDHDGRRAPRFLRRASPVKPRPI